jgi:small-conductance mechanosensitive channel
VPWYNPASFMMGSGMDTARDIIIIIWGALSILTLLVVLLIALFIGLSIKRLVDDVNKLVNTSIKPVIDTTQQSVQNIAGTTQFMGDTVVTPVIRVISVAAGVRRGAAVFLGLKALRRRRGGRQTPELPEGKRGRR